MRHDGQEQLGHRAHGGAGHPIANIMVCQTGDGVISYFNALASATRWEGLRWREPMLFPALPPHNG